MPDKISLLFQTKSSSISEFKCTFQTSKRSMTIISDVNLSFDDDLQECRIIILGNFDRIHYPSVFRRPYKEIRMTDKEIFFAGKFRNPKFGWYNVYISQF
ncbi:MAG: hypothetical protein V4572_02480 [Bacteroidota bacterium]